MLIHFLNLVVEENRYLYWAQTRQGWKFLLKMEFKNWNFIIFFNSSFIYHTCFIILWFSNLHLIKLLFLNETTCRISISELTGCDPPPPSVMPLLLMIGVGVQYLSNLDQNLWKNKVCDTVYQLNGMFSRKLNENMILFFFIQLLRAPLASLPVSCGWKSVKSLWRCVVFVPIVRFLWCWTEISEIFIDLTYFIPSGQKQAIFLIGIWPYFFNSATS